MPPSTSDILWQQGDSWRLCVDDRRRGYIQHPGAVVLVPLLTPDTVLLLRQYRHVLDQTILELPAGTRGWEEAWLACAQRELREETGYRAADLIFLGEIWPAPGVSDELMRIYLAAGLTHDPLPADADEQIEVVPTPLAEALLLARDGRVRDAKTIIGLLRLAQHSEIRD